MSIYLYIYNIFVYFFSPIIFLIYFFLNKKKSNSNFIKNKLGIYNENLINKFNKFPKIWIHACSVGEVSVANNIIQNLNNKYEKYSIILSTSTITGNKYAKKIVRKNIIVIYAPLDIYSCVRRALLKIKPDIIVYIETEIWPNWINLANKFKIMTCLLNGRISKKSIKKYNKVAFLLNPIIKKIDALSMISSDDKLRAVDIGAYRNNISVHGNIKFDLVKNINFNININKIYSSYGIPNNLNIIVAGSIRGSEENYIINAYIKIKAIFSNSILIIAPRHLHRISYIEQIIKKNKISYIKKSKIKSDYFHKKTIIILDTMGDLMLLYSIATIVFCGGSLINYGGHNILEAAIWSKPIIHGPYMDDFKDIIDLFKKAGASIQIRSSNELIKAIIKLLCNTAYAKKIGMLAKNTVLANQGTSIKHIKILDELIKKYN